MATSRQHNEKFGVPQLLALGALLLVGACLVPVLKIANPAQLNRPLDLALWIVEGLAYLLLGWLLARQAAGAIFALALGFATRIVASVLISLLTKIPVFAITGYWIAHLLAVLIAVLALSISFRGLLRRTESTRATKAKDKVHFSFDRTTNAPRKAPDPITTPQVPLGMEELSFDDGATEQTMHLRPPEDFAPVLARNDITGTINIPASVILESVPEARSILNSASAVSVRLAVIVPQMSRATIWLTWQQAFDKGVPAIANIDTAKLEPEFYSRWIRVPARYYVLQVPQEHFKVKKVQPSWMQLPELENEAEITFTA